MEQPKSEVAKVLEIMREIDDTLITIEECYSHIQYLRFKLKKLDPEREDRIFADLKL